MSTENTKSEGLGDTVAKITKVTKIDKLVEKLSGGKDCGCNKRKQTLNKIVPYKNNK